MSESVYRNAMLLIVVCGLTIALYHRLRVRTSEKLDRRQEGRAILIPLRLLGTGSWISVFLYLINPRWLSWSSVELPAWLRWSGAGLGALGVIGIYWVMSSLGRNLTDTVVTRATATLVTHGPYHWIRHPLYTTAAVFFTGLSLLAATWFFLVWFFPAMVLLIVRTRIEEGKLVERFGEAYTHYMERTGRFLPRLP